MAYVDLNPVRAVMATTPEQSDHTSIQLPIAYWKGKATGNEVFDPYEDFLSSSFMSFAGDPRQPMPSGLVFILVDYLQLVDWTGRAIRDDKCGSIPEDTPPIIQHLAISVEHRVEVCTNF